MNKLAPLAAGLALTASAANAALIHANGNVTLVSSTVIATPGGIADASDGVTTLPTNGQLYTNDPGGYPSDYFAFAGPIIFDVDLGSSYLIDSIAFFNRDSAGNSNAVQTFSAQFATDAGFTNITHTTGNLTALNTGPGQQDFALGTTATAQYVRVTISDNYYNPGNPGAGGDRTGFNDIQFNAVPEPSSAALLGLGGLAMIMRRRKG